MLVLYRLSLKVFRSSTHPPTIAFIAACLHIFSSAGLFLSAPCSESLFAALQFLGHDVYADSWLQGSSRLRGEVRLVLSGLLFGLAALVRSNGIFSGLPFAIDAINHVVQVARGGPRASNLRRLIATVIGGCCIFIGAAFPQVLAWLRYCGRGATTETIRPWCDRLIPSIYTFVQAHYW